MTVARPCSLQSYDSSCALPPPCVHDHIGVVGRIALPKELRWYIEQSEARRSQHEHARPLAQPELCHGQGDWSGWAEDFESGRAVNRWKEPGIPCGCMPLP